jgi:hypothetical protein
LPLPQWANARSFDEANCQHGQRTSADADGLLEDRLRNHRVDPFHPIDELRHAQVNGLPDLSS